MHHGRIKSVEYVYKNGVALTGGTDYFIDYQRGRVTLARGLTYSESDIITVDFTGAVNEADEAIQTGAAIFRDIMINRLGLTDDDLDLDSIWATHLAKTTALSLYVWKETDSQELIRRIERSVQAYTYQNAEGKLGLRVSLTSAPSDIVYVLNAHVLDFGMSRSRDAVYSTVNVWYAENTSADKFALYQGSNTQLSYKYKVTQPLDVYTALTTASQAADLAADITGLLDKERIAFTVPRCLFLAMPGDLIYLTRTRYYDTSGTAGNKLLRVLSVAKSFVGGRTTVVAEVV
jgi:hypothetical protein